MFRTVLRKKKSLFFVIFFLNYSPNILLMWGSCELWRALDRFYFLTLMLKKLQESLLGFFFFFFWAPPCVGEVRGVEVDDRIGYTWTTIGKSNPIHMFQFSKWNFHKRAHFLIQKKKKKRAHFLSSPMEFFIFAVLPNYSALV